MIIVSMTTIPCRQKRLEENLESILNQSYRFDKLVINIDDNLTEEDYIWYNKLKERDERIEINVCDHKWRSCNKLLPTIQKYPDAVVITVDDDIYYPKDCIKALVDAHIANSDCIICHEAHPLLVNENHEFLGYANDIYDFKLEHKCYSKYMSNCLCAPPHIFDGTDLFDYDKMIECTNGDHDELWFWINSTIKGIPVIVLDYVTEFMYEVKSQWDKSEYRLCNINNPEKSKWYNDKVKEIYGDRINNVIKNYSLLLYLNKDNIFSFLYQLPKIQQCYANFGISLNIDNLTNGYRNIIYNLINQHK